MGKKVVRKFTTSPNDDALIRRVVNSFNSMNTRLENTINEEESRDFITLIERIVGKGWTWPKKAGKKFMSVSDHFITYAEHPTKKNSNSLYINL